MCLKTKRFIKKMAAVLCTLDWQHVLFTWFFRLYKSGYHERCSFHMYFDRLVVNSWSSHGNTILNTFLSGFVGNIKIISDKIEFPFSTRNMSSVGQRRKPLNTNFRFKYVQILFHNTVAPFISLEVLVCDGTWLYRSLAKVAKVVQWFI